MLKIRMAGLNQNIRREMLKNVEQDWSKMPRSLQDKTIRYYLLA